MTWGRFDPPVLQSASRRKRPDERRTTARPVACPFGPHCLASYSHGATCRSRQKRPRLDHSALPSRTQPERSHPRARQAIVASWKKGCKQTIRWPADAGLAGIGHHGRDRKTNRAKSSWPAQRAGLRSGVESAGIEPANDSDRRSGPRRRRLRRETTTRTQPAAVLRRERAPQTWRPTWAWERGSDSRRTPLRQERTTRTLGPGARKQWGGMAWRPCGICKPNPSRCLCGFGPWAPTGESSPARDAPPIPTLAPDCPSPRRFACPPAHLAAPPRRAMRVWCRPRRKPRDSA